jgi:beta-D-xylosidase 4
LLSEEVIDIALRRLYEGLVRAGYFDPADASPYRSIGWSDVNTPEAQTLALQSAADGLVLLKNDGTLPLNLQGKSVALIGFWANTTRQMLGGYSGFPPYLHSPVSAASQLDLTYHYAPGPVSPSNTTQDTWTTPALAAANKSDIILYFGGTDGSIASEDLDRDSIAWPAAQLTLIQALSSLNKPLIVTQLGDQVDDTPLLTNPNISAILWAGYPGQAGGLAVLNTITGISPPAGRLPVTQYPASYTSQLPMTDMSLRPSNTTGNPGRTYRWYPQSSAVLPFGHGLHYTTFRPRFGVFPSLNLTTSGLLEGCTAAHRDLCPFPPQVSVWVTNEGNVTSDYVALVFVRGEFGPAPWPIKTLVGYKRVRAVKPGETAAGVVEVKVGDLARVDERGNRVLYPGRYRFVLDVELEGGSEVEFEVGGEEVVLDEFPQPRSRE